MIGRMYTSYTHPGGIVDLDIPLNGRRGFFLLQFVGVDSECDEGAPGVTLHLPNDGAQPKGISSETGSTVCPIATGSTVRPLVNRVTPDFYSFGHINPALKIC